LQAAKFSALGTDPEPVTVPDDTSMNAAMSVIMVPPVALASSNPRAGGVT
jgi:hypothetical protein